MAIYSEKARLTFFSSGAEKWTGVKSQYAAYDLAYCNGRFYANGNHGRVVVVNRLREGPKAKAIYVAPLISLYLPRPFPEFPHCNHLKPYLVESSGELLQVWRLVTFLEDEDDEECLSYETIGVKVFKIDTRRRGRVEVRSFGSKDTLLFLGMNSPISVSAKDFLGLNKGNQIYFVDDY